MNSTIVKYGLLTFALAAVIYPIGVRFGNLTWSPDPIHLSANLFPFFGILPFTLLWLHSLAGLYYQWLDHYIDLDQFIHITASIILVCLIAHPLLILASLDFSISNTFIYYGKTYIWLGIIGWLLLIIYDITRPLKICRFFSKNWTSILVISNIGFVITFFHSLALGSDLQSGFLRYVWIFYGVTAIIALTYTYAIRPLLKK